MNFSGWVGGEWFHPILETHVKWKWKKMAVTTSDIFTCEDTMPSEELCSAQEFVKEYGTETSLMPAKKRVWSGPRAADRVLRPRFTAA